MEAGIIPANTPTTIQIGNGQNKNAWCYDYRKTKDGFRGQGEQENDG